MADGHDKLIGPPFNYALSFLLWPLPNPCAHRVSHLIIQNIGGMPHQHAFYAASRRDADCSSRGSAVRYCSGGRYERRKVSGYGEMMLVRG